MAIKAYAAEAKPVEAHIPSDTPATAEAIAANVNIDVKHKPYAGPYSVTPSSSSVVLLTSGYKMTQNVTVDPIPSNYGLITWNGSVLTVS